MSILNDVSRVLKYRARNAAVAIMARTGDPLCRIMHRPAGEHTVYAELRARGPVHQPKQGPPLLLSHRLCSEVLRDTRIGMRLPGGRSASPNNTLSGTFIEYDPPDHTRLRRLAAPAFRPRLLRDYRTRIEKVTLDLLHSAVRKGEFDLVTDFASPLPIAVISDLLGIPDEHADRFARNGRLMAESPMGTSRLGHQRAINAAIADLGRLFADLMEQRRADPRDDVISLLTAAESEDRITADELVKTCGLLLIAGFETTVNLIGNATKLLTDDHPAQWALLKQDPDLAPRAVEEVLRYAPPVPFASRICQETVDLDGRSLPPKTMLMLLFAAANRDPEAYAEPDQFLLERAAGEPEHLSFSSGIHYCLGAPLARMEGEVALRAMIELMPNLRVIGEPTPRPTNVLRGYLHLPVAV
ncbi:cytochrome P450 [Amycolatopsis suaedae]|uniref:Cytochrome P450 n=1 Tax=Amycolatopsis suaedae TaxID=2510978 RepID=A0A4Q7J1S5_9PSEU|nr:cytochrome P450 [Amycolatopsis suaedae]RZQ60436.1 cytochrome P450 [Amycolatopsis suaedae]